MSHPEILRTVCWTKYIPMKGEEEMSSREDIVKKTFGRFEEEHYEKDVDRDGFQYDHLPDRDGAVRGVVALRRRGDGADDAVPQGMSV